MKINFDLSVIVNFMNKNCYKYNMYWLHIDCEQFLIKDEGCFKMCANQHDNYQFHNNYVCWYIHNRTEDGNFSYQTFQKWATFFFSVTNRRRVKYSKITLLNLLENNCHRFYQLLSQNPWTRLLLLFFNGYTSRNIG